MKLKTKRYGYQDVHDAIETSVKWGIRHTYKHLMKIVWGKEK
jgi:hypothetical protein